MGTKNVYIQIHCYTTFGSLGLKINYDISECIIKTCHTEHSSKCQNHVFNNNFKHLNVFIFVAAACLITFDE